MLRSKILDSYVTRIFAIISDFRLIAAIFSSNGIEEMNTKFWTWIENQRHLFGVARLKNDFIWYTFYEEGSAVASWLVRSSPNRVVRVRALVKDIVLCSWTGHFTLTIAWWRLAVCSRNVEIHILTDQITRQTVIFYYYYYHFITMNNSNLFPEINALKLVKYTTYPPSGNTTQSRNTF